MEPRKLFNTEQNGTANYNKMEEENSSQIQINNLSQSTNRLTNNVEPEKGCQWPHKWSLDECCCGCSLRVATLLIGWFYLIGSSLLLFGFSFFPAPDIYRWEDVVFTSVKIVSSVILLIGVYKERHRLIRASAVLYLIDLFVEVILGIILALEIGQIFPIIFFFIGLPLGIYFLVVVNSFASEIAAGVTYKNKNKFLA